MESIKEFCYLIVVIVLLTASPTSVANQAPMCDGAYPSEASLWPPNHKLRSITIEGIGDSDGDSLSTAIQCVRQDEPLNTTGDGNTRYDASGVGSDTVQIRAERAGNRNGRVYHIYYLATDAHGGQCAGVVQVGVRKSPPKIAGDGGPLYDSAPNNIDCSASVPNVAPVANSEQHETVEEQSISIDLNATDADLDELSYTLVSQPEFGELTGQAPSLFYQPIVDYFGNDEFQFQVNDGLVNSNIATISISVTPVNDVPVAEPQSLQLNEDQSLSLSLIGSDIESTELSYTLVSEPQFGSLSGSAPDLVYTPYSNYSGSDQFEFLVSDGEADSAPALIQLTVLAINDLPFANDQHVTTAEDNSVSIVLTAIDIDDPVLQFSLVSLPANGVISGMAPNLSYQPNADFNGSDTLTFEVFDGQANSNLATVSISIEPVNDAPSADDVELSTLEDTPLAFQVEASDIDGDNLSYQVTNGPMHGNFVGEGPDFNYSPNAHYFGSDQITMIVSDGIAETQVAITIDVQAVNDAPSANPDAFTLAEDQLLDFVLSGSDPEESLLSYNVVQPPLHGKLSGNAPNLSYTPNTNFNGSDQITYIVSDGELNSAEVSVTFLVTPVYDKPQAQSQALGTDEDIGLELVLAATDPDSDPLAYAVVQAPQHGILIGTAPQLVYQPSVDFNGQDQFTFKANDGELDSNMATVTINVAARNDAPHVQDQHLQTPFGQAIDFVLFAIDVENDPISYTIINTPQIGTLSGVAPNLRYAPDADFTGLVELQYTVNDGELDSVLATVTIEVLPNQPPRIVSEAKTNHVLQPLVGVEEPVSLTNWLPEVIWDGSQPTPFWRLDNQDRAVRQLFNADPSVFVSDFPFKNGQIRGTFSVETNFDNDYIGFVFGYQDTKQFYLFDWKQSSQSNALEGMNVKRFTGPNFIDLWPTFPTNGSGVSLYHNNIGWRSFVDYEFILSFFPGEFSITVRDIASNTVLDSFTIQDDLYTTGKVGFYNYSQEEVSYRSYSIEVTSDREYIYPVIAEDDENDTLSYSLENAPAGMSIDSASGEIRWVTTTDDVGEYPVTVLVQDGHGGEDRQSFTLRVVNTVPAITSQPVQSTEVFTLYAYDVAAQDPNPEDQLSYSLVEAPDGMIINELTGLIQWFPLSEHIGPNQVDIEVRDPAGGYDRQRYTLNVIPVTDNPRPVIESNPDLFAQVDIEYHYQVSAIDDQSLPLTYQLVDPLSGMQINSESGLFSWTATVEQIGNITIIIRVTDPLGGVTLQQFNVTVLDGTSGNNLPQITSQPLLFARVGDDYRYQLLATDVDNQSLDYSFIHAPQGMSISANGEITWQPPTPGSFPIEVRVTDPDGHYVSQRWTLLVVATDIEFTANIEVSPTVVNESEIVTITVIPTLGIGSVIPSVVVDGQAVTNTLGVSTVVASGIGAHPIEVTLTSPYETVIENATFFVRDPNDQVSPVATLHSPTDNDVISAPTEVIASIFDSNLVSWQVSIVEQGGNLFNAQVLAQGNANVDNAAIATIDPSLLRNGRYVLVLEATEGSGLKVQDAIGFLIDDDLKVGNFSITFEDLNIPLAGIPISVKRTYDSRDKAKLGDFGFGWSLDYRNLKLEESRRLGIGWERSSIAIVFGVIQLHCITPQGAPQVSVTLPDGSVERFEAFAEPDCRRVFPLQTVDIEYRALGDTTSTLEALDDSVGFFKDGNLVEDGFFTVPLDPRRYRLTTKEGFVFIIDDQIGLLSASDPNGNTLTYTDDGIIHSGGESVLFNRDGLGRITSITDPAGNALNYQYNAELELERAVERDSAATSFTYNSRHGLLDIIDPLGRNIVKNIYNDVGRLIAQEDAEGNRKEFSHDVHGCTNVAGAGSAGETNFSCGESIVTDRNGNTEFIYYDEVGNVTSTVDALGNTTQFSYDAKRNQLSQTNALGFTQSATYNERNDQLTQRDELGNITRFEYNNLGKETRIVDARGNAFNNQYNPFGNLTSVTDPLGNNASNSVNFRGLSTSTEDALGNETQFTYDDDGNKLTETDSLGNVTTFAYDTNNNVLSEARTRLVNGVSVVETTRFEYDERDRVVKTIDALGNINSSEYDLVGNLATSVDALGRRTTFEYDPYSRLTRTNYPDASFASNSYDPEGNLLSETDRLGRTTTHVYDAVNRLINSTQADGSITRTEYNAISQVVAEVDANGNRTEHEYDAAGRRTKTTDALNNVTRFAYDADGNLISMTDALGNITSHTYNALDQKTATTYANAQITREGFDALSRKISQTDEAGIVTRFQYDGLGRLIKVIDTLNQETIFSYDSAGNKLSQTDANGRATHWTYDALGRVLSRTLPMGQSEYFTYDALGNLVCHWDFNAQTTATIASQGCASNNDQTAKHSYDVNNRLVRSDYADGMVETWAYDFEGNRTQATKTESGITTTWNYTYDALNRLASETQFAEGANEVTLSYGYDANGNRTRLTETRGALSKQTPFTFDQLNRLKTVVNDSGTTSYGYDAVGNRSDMNQANGTTVSYAYDTRHRLTELSHRNAANDLIAQYQYTLHPTGKRTAIVEHSGRRSDYVFDDLYRLTSESITDAVNGDHNAVFSYDAVGNRIGETINGIQTAYSYDANDRLTQTGGKVFAYDRNGNTLTQTLDGVVTSYSYNAQNEMVSSHAAGITTGYRYNTDGIRVGRSEGTETTLYTIDANRDYAQVIAEQVDGVEVVNYLYGDDLISQQRNGDDFTYLYDGLGSTRVLSDATGAVTDTYNYDAFGETLNQTGSTINDYLFTGEQYDAGLDQYYLRARYYDQNIGRFTQLDTWMGNNSDPVTLHKYLYANADPVNFVDPTGNFGIGGFAAASNIQATLGSFQAELGFNILDSIISGETPSSSASLKIIGIAALGAGGIKLLTALSRKARKIFKEKNANGAGPIPGSIEVSSSTASVALFKNFAPKREVQYVFDPKSKRILFNTKDATSGHPILANAIDADHANVVGGHFIRSKSGEIITNEKSGHFFQNWSPKVREQFIGELQRLSGQVVKHSEGL